MGAGVSWMKRHRKGPSVQRCTYTILYQLAPSFFSLFLSLLRSLFVSFFFLFFLLLFVCLFFAIATEDNSGQRSDRLFHYLSVKAAMTVSCTAYSSAVTKKNPPVSYTTGGKRRY